MNILNSASKIAMLSIVFALIILTGLRIEITEPLKSISLMIIGFYFGKNQSIQKKDISENQQNASIGL